MADPKYADLPGIDYESKDVYESGDLPEEDQIFEGDQSDNVEIVGVDTKELFDRFSNKYVSGRGDNLESNDDTILQKFSRLNLEVNDLMAQIAKVKETKTEDATDLLEKLQTLQTQLKQEESNQYLTEKTDGNIANLLGAVKVSQKQGKSEIAKGQQKIQPDVDQRQNLRIVELEQRLARLEKVLGNESKQLSVLAPQGTTLRESVYHMGSKLAMLDNDNLPQVDSRLQAILTKVNEINKAHKGGGDQPTEINQKVTEMYEMMRKWEKVRENLPYLIERLQSLDTLHSKAADFTATLAHLESTQTQITSRLDSSNSTQKKLTETLKQNVSTIQANIDQLNKRMKDLKM